MSIEELLDQTIIEVNGTQEYEKEPINIVTFTLKDGRVFKMQRIDDEGGTVSLIDVCGDAADLIGSPVVRAEENSNKDEPKPEGDCVESWTWTFYILGTLRGTVTFRWLGQSNGYYSERVDVDCVSTE